MKKRPAHHKPPALAQPEPANVMRPLAYSMPPQCTRLVMVSLGLRAEWGRSAACLPAWRVGCGPLGAPAPPLGDCSAGRALAGRGEGGFAYPGGGGGVAAGGAAGCAAGDGGCRAA